MDALQVAEFNRNLATALYNAALTAHGQRPWDKDLSAALAAAVRAYQSADDDVVNAPGYQAQFK